MKKIISLLLICVVVLSLFTGCDRQSAALQPTAEPQQEGNFAPVTTAVASAEQAKAVEEAVQATAEPAADVPADEPAVPVDEPGFTVNPTNAPADAVPFSTPTPQPNTHIASYSEIGGTGLGFKFSRPSDWVNIPGRSTVCYVQPLENGTVYPARVAVTMKKLPHKCTAEEAQNELVEYLKLLMTQYDEKTFKVSKEMDTETKFMGKNGMSTTYLAYDGEQEIQGYVILTYFERYVYVYHFLSAYEDYEAFSTAMRHMRDSVQVEQTQAE